MIYSPIPMFQKRSENDDFWMFDTLFRKNIKDQEYYGEVCVSFLENSEITFYGSLAQKPGWQFTGRLTQKAWYCIAHDS